MAAIKRSPRHVTSLHALVSANMKLYCQLVYVFFKSQSVVRAGSPKPCRGFSGAGRGRSTPPKSRPAWSKQDVCVLRPTESYCFQASGLASSGTKRSRSVSASASPRTEEKKRASGCVASMPPRSHLQSCRSTMSQKGSDRRSPPTRQGTRLQLDQRSQTSDAAQADLHPSDYMV